MNKKPLVSICIPNYNYGQYLSSCLDSILNQTYDNIEVFFRDNCSNDNSYEIAQSYRKKFRERGYYFSISDNKQNFGSLVNSKLAMRDINGKYIHILASDDIIKSTFIEKCVNVFLNNDNVMQVMVHREEIDENGNVTQSLPFYNESCIIDGESQAAVHMMAGIAIPTQKMIDRSLLEAGKYYDKNFQIAGDWFYNFLYCCFGDVAYIKQPLVQYRVHNGNETSIAEKTLRGVFEHYNMLNSFKDLAQTFKLKKPLNRYNEAVEKLGEMCLRYALKMIKNNLYDVAEKYLFLAPVFKKNITEELFFKELKECLSSEREYAASIIKKYENDKLNKRIISYNPPDGYIKINSYGYRI